MVQTGEPRPQSGTRLAAHPQGRRAETAATRRAGRFTTGAPSPRVSRVTEFPQARVSRSISTAAQRHSGTGAQARDS